MGTGIADLLNTVAGTGEAVTIVYLGGSTPGQARSVIPVSLAPDKLVAIDQTSTQKSYRLDRIASVELSDGRTATNDQAVRPKPVVPRDVWEAASDVPTLDSLGSYVQHYRTELLTAGWHLHETNDTFGVGTHHKNGKPKRRPSILLQYFPQPDRAYFINTLTLSIDETGEVTTTAHTEADVKPARKGRPWRIDSWRRSTGKTFTDLSAAFATFLAEARASDPKTSKHLYAAHDAAGLRL